MEEREFADGLPFRYRQPSILAAKRTGCLDLSPYANANRTSAATELSGLPVGRHTWAGIEFELSDVIMLAGARLTQLGLDFPEQVTGIRVGRNCRLIHFLHSGYRDREAHMASYVIHFANGLTWEIPVTGEHVSTWRVDRYAEQRPNEAKRCVTAWQGEDKPGLVQLSVASWGNPLPDLPVESIALVSGGSWGSVFVAAITVE